MLSEAVYLLFFLILLVATWRRNISKKCLFRILNLINIFFLTTYLIYVITCSINIDDFEHIYSSWLVYKGCIPYHDFFQHHHPLLWYVLSPIFFVGEGLISILVIRILNYFFFVGTLILCYKIVLEISNSREIALYSFTVLLSINIFSRHSMTVRPDVLMTFLALFSFYYFVRFWITRNNYYLIYSGIFIALSFFTLQKVVFIMIPLIGILIFLLIKGKISVRQLFILGISAFVPLLFFLGIYTLTGHFKEYIVYGWVFNFLKEKEFHFSDFFKNGNGLLIVGNFILVVVFSFIQFIKKIKLMPVLFLICFVTGIIGFILFASLSAVYMHYFVLVIPFLLIPSGYFFWQFFEKFKTTNKLRIFLFYILFAITLPVQVKKIYDGNLYQQMEKIKYIKDNVTENGKVLTSIPGVLFVKNAHFMFYQNNQTKRNNMIKIYEIIINDPRFHYWITDKFLEDSMFDPRKIINEQKPEFIFAREHFFEDYSISEIVQQNYVKTKYTHLYRSKE